MHEYIRQESHPSVGLEVSLLVGKDWIGECRDQTGLAIVGSVSETKERGQETRNDENGEQNDECGRKGGRAHADITLVPGPTLGDGRVHVDDRVVIRLLDGESKVARAHNLDDLLYADIFKIDLDCCVGSGVKFFATGFTTASAIVGLLGCSLGTSVAVLLDGGGLGGAVTVLLRLCNGRSVSVGGVVDRCRLLDGLARVALVRTLVSANLDGTLEVDLHAVGELEGLEVGITEDRSGGPKVLNLGELRHELGPGDTSLLVHKLNGSTLSVMSHTVSDHHVKLLLVILDGKDHGHGLSNLDKSRDFRSPGALSDLDLHPASNVVPSKVSTDHIEHVNGERSGKRGRNVD